MPQAAFARVGAQLFLGKAAQKSNVLCALLACIALAGGAVARSWGCFHFRIAAPWPRCTCSGAGPGGARTA